MLRKLKIVHHYSLPKRHSRASSTGFFHIIARSLARNSIPSWCANALTGFLVQNPTVFALYWAVTIAIGTINAKTIITLKIDNKHFDDFPYPSMARFTVLTRLPTFAKRFPSNSDGHYSLITRRAVMTIDIRHSLTNMIP